MIRQFEMMDVRRLKPNEFSKPKDVMFVFDDDSFYKNTMEDDNGRVLCIIGFKRYWQNNFVGFFLLSEEIEPIHARELKRFIDNAMIDMEADRLQTDSVSCLTLDKWHRFLKFELEGVRKKMLYGKDYKLWARMGDAWA